MDLIIKINLDDDLYESDLEKVFEQIQWHLERRGSWLKNFGITAADGKTLGTVEVNRGTLTAFVGDVRHDTLVEAVRRGDVTE